MTTPNEETIKSKKDFLRFFESALKPNGFNDEEFEEFLERSKNSNPGANPQNPWVVAEKQRERDI